MPKTSAYHHCSPMCCQTWRFPWAASSGRGGGDCRVRRASSGARRESGGFGGRHLAAVSCTGEDNCWVVGDHRDDVAFTNTCGRFSRTKNRRGLVLECAPAPSAGGMTSMAVEDGRYLGISEVAES